MIRVQQTNTITKLWRKYNCIKLKIDATPSTDTIAINTLEEQIVDVANEILHAVYNLNTTVQVLLTEEEKGEWQQKEKAYGERVNKRILYQQKAFAIIIGCMAMQVGQRQQESEATWQNNQSNAQWYKKLNTHMDVAESVGVEFDNFNAYGAIAARQEAGANMTN